MGSVAAALARAFPVREVVDLQLVLMHIFFQPGNGIVLHPELSGDEEVVARKAERMNVKEVKGATKDREAVETQNLSKRWPCPVVN